MDNALGYKLDKLSDPQKVTTHGNYLPAVPKDSNFYVYTGDESGYKERSFDDWKNQDLETFFNTTSNFPAHDINKGKTSLLDKVFPKAYAHGGEDDGNDGEPGEETVTTPVRSLPATVGMYIALAFTILLGIFPMWWFGLLQSGMAQVAMK